MKRILTALLLTTLCYGISAQSSYLDRRGKTQLWGKHDASAFEAEPFNEWFAKSIADYDPELKHFSNVNTLKNTKVTIYLGTWCGDSKKWVPKFHKLWNELGLSDDQLEFISLGNGEGRHKKGPNLEEKGMNIHKVPTFIFTKNDQEIGRIVERPLTTLEVDLAQINLGIPSPPRYRAVSILNEYFSNYTPQDSGYVVDVNMIYRKIVREVSRPGELNTYGYILSESGEKEQAEFVFLLNTYLFKHTPNCHDSLGEIYMELGKWEEAKECFHRVMDLSPKDERAIEMIFEINQALAEG